MSMPFSAYYLMPRQTIGSLEKTMENLIQITKMAIQNDIALKEYFSPYRVAILQFRVELSQKYPNWYQDFRKNIDNILKDLSEWEQANSRFKDFEENLEFAIQSNVKIMESVMDKPLSEVIDITNPAFEHWIENSCLIEFASLVAIIIKHEGIEISDERLKDFSEMTETAAYDFAEISQKLGLIRFLPVKVSAKLKKELSQIKRMTPKEKVAFRKKHAIKKEVVAELQALWADSPPIEELMAMMTK